MLCGQGKCAESELMKGRPVSNHKVLPVESTYLNWNDTVSLSSTFCTKVIGSHFTKHYQDTK